MSYFVNSSSLERLFGLLFGCGGERSSEPPPGVPRPFTAISISGSSSEESTSINVLDAAMPAIEINKSVRRDFIGSASGNKRSDKAWKYTKTNKLWYHKHLTVHSKAPLFCCLII